MPFTTLPEFSVFDTDAGEPSLRWAILGTGQIAGHFAQALRRHTIQRLTAVGSRSLDSAARFAAAQGGAAAAHGSYSEAIEAPDVDVVYIATPHSEHVALAREAIAAGKHVLIEKPMAMDADDAAAVLDKARRAGVLAMEALWTRYLPHTSLVRALLAEGFIGDPLAVTAHNGFPMPFDPAGRLFDPKLGGGALLDLGPYPVQLDSMVFGAPEHIIAVGELTSTGVDADASLILEHGPGRRSMLGSTMTAVSPGFASIAGTRARIDYGQPFFVPTSVAVVTPDGSVPDLRWDDNDARPMMEGLSWEATALARFVGDGRLESPLHTHEETVSILRTLTTARDLILAAAGR